MPSENRAVQIKELPSKQWGSLSIQGLTNKLSYKSLICVQYKICFQSEWCLQGSHGCCSALGQTDDCLTLPGPSPCTRLPCYLLQCDSTTHVSSLHVSSVRMQTFTPGKRLHKEASRSKALGTCFWERTADSRLASSPGCTLKLPWSLQESSEAWVPPPNIFIGMESNVGIRNFEKLARWF